MGFHLTPEIHITLINSIIIQYHIPEVSSAARDLQMPKRRLFLCCMHSALEQMLQCSGADPQMI